MSATSSRWARGLAAVCILATFVGPGTTAQAQSEALKEIVLPDDARRRPGDPSPLSPVVLRVPEALQPKVQTFSQSEVTVSLHYPSMRRWNRSEHRCFSFCVGRLDVTLRRAAIPALREQVDAHRRSLVRTERFNQLDPGGIAEVARLPTHPGYDESWSQSFGPGDPTVSTTFHLRDAAGAPPELAICDVKAQYPTCMLVTEVENGMQLTLLFSAAQWDEREAVRKAAVGLVGSFIAP